MGSFSVLPGAEQRGKDKNRFKQNGGSIVVINYSHEESPYRFTQHGFG